MALSHMALKTTIERDGDAATTRLVMQIDRPTDKQADE